MKAFYGSVSVHVVVVLFADGGDIWPLYVVIELFPFQVVGTLKPSIEYALLPFAPFAPLRSPSLPLSPLLSKT